MYSFVVDKDYIFSSHNCSTADFCFDYKIYMQLKFMLIKNSSPYFYIFYRKWNYLLKLESGGFSLLFAEQNVVIKIYIFSNEKLC